MSQIQIKEFCYAILTDKQYLNSIPAWCRDELLQIDIELTRDNIDVVLKQIYRNVLNEKINKGRIISLLAFGDTLTRRYSWCTVNILVNILTDILLEIRFNPNDLMTEFLAKKMNEENWAIMDVEYIQTSKTHQCVRKLYIRAKDGFTDLELEFYPCMQYKDLDEQYQRAFNFCKSRIHKLEYNPNHQYAPACNTVVAKLNTFVVYNGIDFILYKGGTIEKDLCSELYIQSYNIENFSEIKKIQSHDPQTEVNYYYKNLCIKLCSVSNCNLGLMFRLYSRACEALP